MTNNLAQLYSVFHDSPKTMTNWFFQALFHCFWTLDNCQILVVELGYSVKGKTLDKNFESVISTYSVVANEAYISSSFSDISFSSAVYTNGGACRGVE
jgi:hypothetical protein